MIYLDHNATTPCDDLVLKTMLPYFNTDYANPSSNHAMGWMANEAIENSTNIMARLLGIQANEIIYTSGATESINMILKGVFNHQKHKGNHIITCKTEHKAVLDVCDSLSGEGAVISYLDVDSNGIVDMEQLKRELSPQTILVCIMLANNETGVIQPMHDIAVLTQANGTLLFSDATQALGKINLDGFFDHVDFACFSAHKLYGPKGVGFTYVKDSHSKMDAFIHGGGQQKGLRGGTLNTPFIIGMGKAVTLAYHHLEMENKRIIALRNRLEKGLLAIESTHLNGTIEQRLPGTVNISFDYVDGANLLRALGTQLAISNGSACNSASVLPSHVLTAMGVKSSLAFASIRLGIGKSTTDAEIDQAIAIIKKEVALQRAENILWERRK